MSTIKVDTITTLDGTGDITVSRPLSGSGASLTNLPAANLTGTVADARISTLTASKLTGALPAISGASLTGISGGKVLQVVQTVYNGTPSSSSATYASVSGFSAAITPSATSSNILVTVDTNFGATMNQYASIILKRESTEIGSGTSATGSQSNTFLHMTHVNESGGTYGSNYQNFFASKTFYDTGISSTSENTYQVFLARLYGSAAVYINRQFTLDNDTYGTFASSTITLLEIGA